MDTLTADLMTVLEVAGLMKSSETFVRTECRAGRLAAVKIGPRGRFLIPRAAVNKYLGERWVKSSGCGNPAGIQGANK